MRTIRAPPEDVQANTCSYKVCVATYQLAFLDPPDDLAERLKPVLVSQGDPPVFVRPAEGA